MMFNVVQINAVYGAKSTGMIVKDIHNTCLAHNVNSFVFNASGQSSERVISLGNPFSNKLHGILTRLFGIQGFCSWITTWRLTKRLNKIHPDIIHLHNIHSNFLHLGILVNYAKKRNVSIILTLHDCWFFTGKCYHFLDVGCDKWQKECNRCPKRRMDIPSILKDNSSKVFRKKKQLFDYDKIHVVGCSRWIVSCAKKSPIFSKASFHQIYNGVDVDLFKPDVSDKRSEYSLKERFVVMVMANKWFDPNNKSVRERIILGLECNDRLIIVGCNEEQLISPSHPKLIYVGYVKGREELADYYRTADAFINVTYVDTLPTVNMEAACCGTPVITFDAGGSSELVDNGLTGYVVSPGDAEGLVQSLRLVKEGRISRSNCSRWAVGRFDMTRNYEEYFDLYKEVLGKK